MSFFRNKEDPKERLDRINEVNKNRPEVEEFRIKLRKIEELNKQIKKIWSEVTPELIEKSDMEFYTDSMEQGTGCSGWPKTYKEYKKWEAAGGKWWNPSSINESIVEKTSEIKEQKLDDDITFLAGKSSFVNQITTTGNLNNISGISHISPGKINSSKNIHDNMGDFIVQNILPQLGRSLKIRLQFGKETLVDTYTPDRDGIIRDEFENTGYRLIINNMRQGKNSLMDIKSAIENPNDHLKITILEKPKCDTNEVSQNTRKRMRSH